MHQPCLPKLAACWDYVLFFIHLRACALFSIGGLARPHAVHTPIGLPIICLSVNWRGKHFWAGWRRPGRQLPEGTVGRRERRDLGRRRRPAPPPWTRLAHGGPVIPAVVLRLLPAHSVPDTRRREEALHRAVQCASRRGWKVRQGARRNARGCPQQAGECAAVAARQRISREVVAA